MIREYFVFHCYNFVSIRIAFGKIERRNTLVENENEQKRNKKKKESKRWKNEMKKLLIYQNYEKAARRYFCT